MSYAYGEDGLRTSKTVNGTVHNYYYTGGQLAAETWTEGNTSYSLRFVYDAGGAPYAVVYSHGGTSELYYYITNLQGDITRIVTTTLSTVVSYTYDAWGNVLSVKNAYGNAITGPTHIANVNPLRYRGYYYDTETQWYYLTTRYYDPNVGRFINSDNEIYYNSGFLGLNLFTYCLNNPIRYNDYNGTYSPEAAEEAFSIWTMISGALCAIDGPFPIGDIIAGIGFIGISIWACNVSSTGADSVMTYPISRPLPPLVIDESISSIDESVAIEAEKDIVLPSNPLRIYYPAVAAGKRLIIDYTRPMTFSEAYAWAMGGGDGFGRTRKWGIYTASTIDAFSMAYELGKGVPIPHGAHDNGFYPHYHVAGHDFGRYKSFHIWFGFPQYFSIPPMSMEPK